MTELTSKPPIGRFTSMEVWLREEVAEVFDTMQADPDRGIPAETVFAEIRAHHAAHLKDKV